MANIEWSPSSWATAITVPTGLVDSGNALGVVNDNTGSSNLYLFDDVQWSNPSFGYVPGAGSYVELYLICRTQDGTNYEDGTSAINPPAANLVGVFNIRSANVAQNHILRQVPIPPDKFKYLIIQHTGAALPSGCLVYRRPYRYQTV